MSPHGEKRRIALPNGSIKHNREVFFMADNKSTEALNKKGALGAVRIADEVVSIIAGLAATEVKGIEGSGDRLKVEEPVW